jgi:hypothetical protein
MINTDRTEPVGVVPARPAQSESESLPGLAPPVRESALPKAGPRNPVPARASTARRRRCKRGTHARTRLAGTTWTLMDVDERPSKTRVLMRSCLSACSCSRYPKLGCWPCPSSSTGPSRAPRPAVDCTFRPPRGRWSVDNPADRGGFRRWTNGPGPEWGAVNTVNVMLNTVEASWRMCVRVTHTCPLIDEPVVVISKACMSE